MDVAGDLTSAGYWEREWAAIPSVGPWARIQTEFRKVTMWKFDRIVRNLLGPVDSPAELLELGCAPGTMLQRIHRLRPQLRLSGIDFAAESCRTMSAVLKRRGLNFDIFHGDMRLAQLPRSFDIVASFGLIEHFDDPVDTLRHHARFCRPGGTVAITIPNFNAPAVRYLAERFCPDNLAVHNLKIMNLQALEAAMRAAGLTNVRVGGDGGTQVHRQISRQDLGSRAYSAAGRVWNTFAVFVPPQLGWHWNLWASGNVGAGV